MNNLFKINRYLKKNSLEIKQDNDLSKETNN